MQKRFCSVCGNVTSIDEEHYDFKVNSTTNYHFCSMVCMMKFLDDNMTYDVNEKIENEVDLDQLQIVIHDHGQEKKHEILDTWERELERSLLDNSIDPHWKKLRIEECRRIIKNLDTYLIPSGIKVTSGSVYKADTSTEWVRDPNNHLISEYLEKIEI